MQKLYTKKNYHEPLFFSGIVLLLFLIGMLLFHPSLNLFQKFHRSTKVQMLLTDIQKPDFNMREYWQFREFYSPGDFTFDSETVSLAGALQFNHITSPTATLLTFHSPLLTSTDSIVEQLPNADYLSSAAGDLNQQKVLFKLSDRIAYQSADKKIHLVFLRPTSEMKQTLGVFDYGANEDKILEHKWWLNQTTISE